MSYMEQPNSSRPHIIVMVGIPGSGKSFFADRFAETFKSPIISFNKLHQALFSNPKYDQAEYTIVKQAADYMLDEILKTGKIVVYEGLSNQRNDRSTIVKKVQDYGYDPIFVWVQTESTTAKRRSTKSIDGRPPMSEEEFDKKLKQFNPPSANEYAVVISGKHTYNTQLKAVLKSIITPPPKPNSPNRTNSTLTR